MSMFPVSGFSINHSEAKRVPEAKRLIVKVRGRAFSRILIQELSAYQMTAPKDKQYQKIAAFISKNQQKLFQELSTNPAVEPLLMKVRVKMSQDAIEANEFEIVKDAWNVIQLIREAKAFYKEMDRWNVIIAWGPSVQSTFDEIAKFIEDNQDWFLYNSKRSLVVGPQCTDKLVRELTTMREELQRQIFAECNSSIVNALRKKLVDAIDAIETSSRISREETRCLN